MMKIFSIILMFSVVAMGIKQGWAMINAQPEMVELFSKCNLDVDKVRLYGMFTVLFSLLILFPRTFTLGNIAMAASILLISIFQLSVHQYLKALIEIPFLLLNVLLIFLKYPFKSLL